MNLLNFVSQYPDEASCKRKWKSYRDAAGVICPHCGGKEHYWKSDKESYACRKCKYRQSLRSNTIMHGSQLPFRYWFIAGHLLTSTKKSFSDLEQQRQLGHSTYNPVWAMLHKIRQAMGKRDSLYTLENVIEVDEDLKSTTIDEKVSKNIDKKATIDSDNSTSYTNFKSPVAQHRPKVIPKNEVGIMLSWVHIAISNAKRMLPDIFHDIKPEYLQNYLHEFCYKFNRRYFGEKLFDRLMVAAV